MDYVTRQFINLTKKFRKELPKISESLRNDIKQQTETIREARDAYDQSRNTPPVLRAELQVPHPIEVQTYPKYKKTGREWYKLVIETLTLLGVIAYAIVTIRMWREMIFARHTAQNAIKEAKHSSDELLEQAQANFIADQRPYLWLSAQDTYTIPNMPVVSGLYVANYGKSPAIRERGIGTVFFGPNAIADADKWFDSITASSWKGRFSAEHIIPPGIPLDPKKTATANVVQSRDPVSPEEFKWIVKNDNSIITVARFEYFDTSGKRYWTDICSARLAGDNAKGRDCPRHNEIH
jgi:hypothetical protein